MWSAWEMDMPLLVQGYLEWKYGTQHNESGETNETAHMFDVAVVSTFSKSFLPSFRYTIRY